MTPLSHRAPPIPTEQRAVETERLIRERATDVGRWADAGNLATQWDARAALAAEWIPAGARVLDVGCGAMSLAGLLKPGCEYCPADVVERRPGAFVVDLNQGQFPPGEYDWVTFLGVLEYVHEPLRSLQQACQAAPRLIATYCTQVGADVRVRRGMGWVNDLSESAFADLLQLAGWRIAHRHEVKRGPTNLQLMFVCDRA
jgi:hypothetical protein